MPNIFGAMGGALKKGLQAPGKMLGKMPGAKPLMGAVNKVPGMKTANAAMGMGQPTQGVGPSQGGMMGMINQAKQKMQPPMQPVPQLPPQPESGMDQMFGGGQPPQFGPMMGQEQPMQPDQQMDPMMQRRKAMMGMRQLGPVGGMNRGTVGQGSPFGNMRRPMQRGIGPSPQMMQPPMMQQDEQM